MVDVNVVLLLALLPAVLGFVNFLKAMGLTGKVLTLASMVSGIVALVAHDVLPPGVFTTAFNGLILGLAACGLYDIAAMVSPWKNASTKPIVEDKAAIK